MRFSYSYVADNKISTDTAELLVWPCAVNLNELNICTLDMCAELCSRKQCRSLLHLTCQPIIALSRTLLRKRDRMSFFLYVTLLEGIFTATYTVSPNTSNLWLATILSH